MPLSLTPLPATLGTACLGVDVTGVVPDRLKGLSTADAARLQIRADGQPCHLGEIFEVQWVEDDRSDDMDDGHGSVVFQGDMSRVHGIAAGMRAGRVMVHGDAGRHAGEGMRGGRLTILGNAGDWLACGLHGGLVHVHGSAGDNAAAALPGHPCGVDGGVVLVEGSVGSLAGARMRRGILAVAGDAGEAAAFEMRAGTVIVAGSLGQRAAASMRRGSVIALGPSPEVWPGFVRGSLWQPAFVPLLLRELTRWGWRAGQTALTRDLGRGPWQHWHGDRLSGGRGELFHRNEG
jgi:formylmethanofuran dehydrogenase subunit C